MATATRVRKPRFGDQRRVRPDVPTPARWLFRTLGVADPAHWLHARYFRDSLRRHVSRSPRRVLDAGCGRGDYSFFLAQLFPTAEVVGIDVDPALIERNARTSELLGLRNVRFAVSDLASLDEESTYDFVVCVDVLEHIRSQADALRNIGRSLAPGGAGFLHIPTVRPKPVIFSRRLEAFHEWAEEEHIADELTAEEFCARVRAAGLDVIEVLPTFGRYTGELATSVFALFFRDSPLNRVAQAAVSPLCRLLAMADPLRIESTRYAVAVSVRKPTQTGAG